ncbi:DUF1761 domain-containing protein [Pseudonocardia sp. CA-107938]|uniref:DUF1761 domain-containing protein n=1 Tax=Pseudonocardia sp. CA-107938 TaxID=3240021 RepID=UPI003D94EC87
MTVLTAAPTPFLTRRHVLYLAAAAAVPLVTASIWYTVFGATWVELSGIDPQQAARPGVGEMLGQLARNVAVMLTMTVLITRMGVRTVRGALAVAATVWFGFEAMAILGSVLHEGYPFVLYLIHVGDALQTALVMGLFIGLARRSGSTR